MKIFEIFFENCGSEPRAGGFFRGDINGTKSTYQFFAKFFHVFCFYHLKNFLKYDKIIKIYAIEEESSPLSL